MRSDEIKKWHCRTLVLEWENSANAARSIQHSDRIIGNMGAAREATIVDDLT